MLTKRWKVSGAFYALLFSAASWVLKRTYPAKPMYLEHNGAHFRCLPSRWRDEADAIIGKLEEVDVKVPAEQVYLAIEVDEKSDLTTLMFASLDLPTVMERTRKHIEDEGGAEVWIEFGSREEGTEAYWRCEAEFVKRDMSATIYVQGKKLLPDE